MSNVKTIGAVILKVLKLKKGNVSDIEQNYPFISFILGNLFIFLMGYIFISLVNKANMFLNILAYVIGVPFLVFIFTVSIIKNKF